MLFHMFSSQEERRSFGGSCFLELQYCRLPRNTAVETIVSVGSIVNWRDDSLYVHGDDQNLFFAAYRHIFDCGINNNLRSGMIDPWGINYYGPETLDRMISKLNERRSKDDQQLMEWLDTAKDYNGIYILGI